MIAQLIDDGHGGTQVAHFIYLSFYVGVLLVNAVILLVVAITGFGASLEYRILSVLGAVASGAYMCYLLNILWYGGRYRLSLYAAGCIIVVSAFAAHRLYNGIMTRERDAADRRTFKALKKESDEWRSTRRW